MNCIIIDDEQHAINVIEAYCKKISYINVLGTFHDPLEAVMLLKTEKIDVVFLDINMRSISGIDFMKAYPIKHVILTTAFSTYAIESYELGVLDYLLKPIAFDRFLKALEKIPHEKQPVEEDFFYVKTDRDKLVKLTFSEIKFIEGLKNYVSIQTKKDKLITLLTMKELLKNLPASKFIQVHKSFIINLDFFESLSGNRIKLIDDDVEIPIGNAFKNDFMVHLKKFTIG